MSVNTVGITERDIEAGWQVIASEYQIDPNWSAANDAGLYQDKPGDAKQSVPQTTEPEIPTKKLLLPILAQASLVACPNWQLTDDEIQGLADGLAPVIDKYLPGGWPALLDRWKEEITAITVVYLIAESRRGVPLRAVEEPTQESAEDSQAAQQPAVHSELEGLDNAA